MIRKANLNDLSRIVELEEKIFGHTLGYAFLKQELIDNPFSKIIVYEFDHNIIGYMSLRVVDYKADILNFLVDKPYQHQGYGKQIFEAVLAELRSENVETIVLEVRVSNQAAISFYEQFGAIHVITLNHYYKDEDAKVMLLEVK